MNNAAATHIMVGRRRVRRFIYHPSPINDGYPRCIACGQVDEEAYHDDALCPATSAAISDRYAVVPDPDYNGAWQVRAPEGFLVFTTETCGPQTLKEAQKTAAISNDELEKRAAANGAQSAEALNPARGPTFDLIQHLHRQRAFSEQTFGPGARTAGVIDHIRKELHEIEAAPADIGEWIDVVLLALDGAWRSGASPEAIAAALLMKQARNEARTWPDWRTSDPAKAIEHDRSGEAAAPVREEGGAVWVEYRRLLEGKVEQWTSPNYLGDDRMEVDDALELAAAIKAALATREEAPVEAGTLIGQINALLAIQNPSHPVPGLARELLERAVAALRAQPQAREEAEPVAWVPVHPRSGPIWPEAGPTAREKENLKSYPFLAVHLAPPTPEAEKLRVAVADIAAERQRQVDVEGWSETHDDEHDDHQMARAAGCYAFHAGREYDDEKGMFVSAAVHHGWPWDRAWWKPKSRRADLVRAGALIVAEIERLDRQALSAEPEEAGE